MRWPWVRRTTMDKALSVAESALNAEALKLATCQQALANTGREITERDKRIGELLASQARLAFKEKRGHMGESRTVAVVCTSSVPESVFRSQPLAAVEHMGRDLGEKLATALRSIYATKVAELEKRDNPLKQEA